MKTLWEKEKMLVTGIFSFSHNVFNPNNDRDCDIVKIDENGRKLSKRVENTVGKGEIARYEQFLLFPQCFQKACFQGASKGVIVEFGTAQTFVVW